MSFSLQDQKLKSRNPILYTLKKTLIKTSAYSTSTYFKTYCDDWNHRKLTLTTQHKDFLFYNARRDEFVNSYWYGEDVPEMTKQIICEQLVK